MADLEILSADTVHPFALQALVGGVPILLVLDTSARMRFSDEWRDFDLRARGPQRRIKDAATRIITLERGLPEKIVITALDL